MTLAINTNVQSQAQSKKYSKTDALRRHFYPTPIFVKWCHILDFLTYSDGLTDSVPSTTNSAGKEYMFRQGYGMNMFTILSFMARHSKRGVNQEGTKGKDVTQAFYGKQAYIMEKAYIRREAVSRALTILVDAGVLDKAEVGSDILYAFSQRTIDALLVYSQKLTEEQKRRKSKIKPKDGQKKPEGKLESQAMEGDGFDQTDPLLMPCSDEQLDECSMDDGEETPQPSKSENKADIILKTKPIDAKNIPGLIDLCQKVESAIKRERPKDYAYWEDTQLFLAGLVDEHGEKVVKQWVPWLKNFMFNHSKALSKERTWIKKLEFCWYYYMDELGTNRLGA